MPPVGGAGTGGVRNMRAQAGSLRCFLPCSAQSLWGTGILMLPGLAVHLTCPSPCAAAAAGAALTRPCGIYVNVKEERQPTGGDCALAGMACHAPGWNRLCLCTHLMHLRWAVQAPR